MSLALTSGSPQQAVAVRPDFAAEARDAVKITDLTGRDWAAWDRYVRTHPDGGLFHTMAWMHSVRDAFGHQCRYLLAKRAGRVVGVLPLFEIRSIFGGTMLVSVPYAVGGGVVCDHAGVAQDLLAAAIKLAERIGANTIDMRSSQRRFEVLSPVDHYVGFERRLPDRAEDVLEWLPRKARAAARNGENKYRLTSEFDRQQLPMVWRLYCRSMRRLGSISYPYRFFEELCERLRDDAHVQIVRAGRAVVAGLVSFKFGDRLIPYFVGTRGEANALSANNYLYMTAMRRAVEVGCKVFDFGRTRIDNTGALNFKRFHGFEPAPLGYQRWTASGQSVADLTPANPRFQLARRVWRRLPVTLCTWMGTRLARHIPG